ncbi:MAG TPA: hypothetical protein VF447_00915, partial [Terriglobales bacterium]
NQTIQYVYDALNRLSQKNYPDSTSANYVYDLVGKIDLPPAFVHEIIRQFAPPGLRLRTA